MAVAAEKLLASPVSQVNDSGEQTNATATATLAAVADRQNIATMAIISAKGTIALGVRATLAWTLGGASKTIGFEIPAANIAPIIIPFGSHGIVGDKNTAITLTLPALGAGINGEAVLLGFQA